MKRVMPITQLMATLQEFDAASWAPWKLFWEVVSARPLSGALESAVEAATGHTVDDVLLTLFGVGRTDLPTEPVRELWLLCGRRAGKSRMAALFAVWTCCCRTWALAPGETGTFMIIAADRPQARIIKKYVSGLLKLLAVAVKAPLIASETAAAIRLTNGLSVEIGTASFRTVRGYTLVGCALDEICFWRSDDTSANPDKEVLTALRAAMASQPAARMVALSSVYAQSGEAFKMFTQHYGHPSSDVVVANAPTLLMNPSISQRVVDRAYADDAMAAAAEYGAQFRRDVSTFVPPDVVSACVMTGCVSEPPQLHTPTGFPRYYAFVDPAGGSGKDAFASYIAAIDAEGVVRLVAGMETRPPFSPEDATRDHARLIRTYALRDCTADRFAAQYPVEAFARHGVTLVHCPLNRSQLYLELLPLLTSGRVQLLDHPRLIAQLSQLERRTGSAGRDSVDHAPNQHDDLSNAAAGAVWLATQDAAQQTGGGMLWCGDEIFLPDTPAQKLSDAEIEDALSGAIALGREDTLVEKYRDGRLSRAEAEKIVQHRREQQDGLRHARVWQL